MDTCIICRKETNDFSDEHVIPDSLGGYYHIYSVCKTCNSDLGSNVDSDLVNHKFSDFQRYLLGIKGKSGKIPNPFSGTHSFSEKTETKVQVRLDSDMKTLPYIIPSVTQNKNNSIVESVSIVVDASDENKIDGIIKKTAKRIGVPYDRISVGEKSIHSSPCPEIHIALAIDLHDFKLGLLKIAYEFAVDSIPLYYNDKMAIDISNVLHNSCHERSTDFVKIGNGFQHEIMQPFEHLLNLDSKKHYLILIQSKSELFCFIKLHKIFTVGVILSNDVHLKENIIHGINDIEEKKFRKLDMFELIEQTHAAPELRFGYWFKSQESITKFQELQGDPNFEVYTEGSEIPLFNSDGTYTGKNVHKKISDLINVAESEPLESGGTLARVKLDEELYLKVMPSGELLQLDQIKEERRQVCRL